MKPSSGGGGESESEDGGGTKHKTTGTALFADLEAVYNPNEVSQYTIGTHRLAAHENEQDTDNFLVPGTSFEIKKQVFYRIHAYYRDNKSCRFFVVFGETTIGHLIPAGTGSQNYRNFLKKSSADQY
jgi:hypothetical protein